VPFGDYKEFTPETLRVMSAAYDAALAKLDISHPDPRTSKIASKIVALIYEGERDPTVLADKACAELTGGTK
jgi:hypothetical protein